MRVKDAEKAILNRLMTSVRNNRVDKVMEILTLHPFLMHQNIGSEHTGMKSMTLVTFVCCFGYVDILRRLLKTGGVEPKYSDLAIAVAQVPKDVENVLDASNKTKNEILWFLDSPRVQVGREACAHMLLEAGVDIDNKDGCSILSDVSVLFYVVEVRSDLAWPAWAVCAPILN